MGDIDAIEMSVINKINRSRRVLRKSQLTTVQKHGKILVVSLILLGMIIGSSYTYIYLELSKTKTVLIDIADASETNQDMGALAKAGAHLDNSDHTGNRSLDDSPEALIKKVAQEEKFTDVQELLQLAHCESRFNPQTTNATNNSYDRGIFQISRKFHPEVSDATAYDVTLSTEWTINRIRQGYLSEWMCGWAYNSTNYNFLEK